MRHAFPRRGFYEAIKLPVLSVRRQSQFSPRFSSLRPRTLFTMSAILSIVDSSFQAHAEQDVSEARVSDVESDGEDHTTTQARPPATTSENSALDSQTASPYELPTFLSAPSARNRRRSEIAFSRPPPKFTIHDPGSHETSLTESQAHATLRSYELSDITPPVAGRLGYVGEEDIEVGKNGKGESAGATPREPSLAYEQDEETRPSAAQRARFKKYSRIHMAALCWCFYLEGWNDGTTGPLLPRIQEFYNVCFTNCPVYLCAAHGVH